MSIKAYSYIRFSTPEQLKGDSLRRQLEASERYAREHNLELDTSLRDYGKSGYDGSNRKKGALKDFFQLIHKGKIPKGSYLLIENLDRLSREKPMDAYDQFREIIKSGIKVVTLSNGFEFTEESLNTNAGQLYIIVGEIQRAHEESKRKSDLVSKAKEKNRKDAIDGKKIFTSICPSWLQPNQDKSDFIIIEERAKAIREVFRLKKIGYGRGRITRIMNSSNFWKPPKSNRNEIGGWQESYINKILYNRAVIGEHQFYKKIDGKRIPVGEPIRYYPPIIEKDLWNEVHAIIKQKRDEAGNFGGKTGNVSNLFSSIAICGKCGAKMHIIDKGKPPKGARYLRCSSAKNGKGCKAKIVRYDKFEKLFFSVFSELNVSDIIDNTDERSVKIKKLNDKLFTLPKQIEDIEKKIERLLELHEDGVRIDHLRMKIETREKELEELKNIQHRLTLELDQLQNEEKDVERNLVSTLEFQQMLATIKDENEKIEMRLRLRTEIRKFIKFIKIYPLEKTPKPKSPYFFERILISYRRGNQRRLQIRTEPHQVEGFNFQGQYRLIKGPHFKE